MHSGEAHKVSQSAFPRRLARRRLRLRSRRSKRRSTTRRKSSHLAPWTLALTELMCRRSAIRRGAKAVEVERSRRRCLLRQRLCRVMRWVDSNLASFLVSCRQRARTEGSDASRCELNSSSRNASRCEVHRSRRLDVLVMCTSSGGSLTPDRSNPNRRHISSVPRSPSVNV